MSRLVAGVVVSLDWLWALSEQEHAGLMRELASKGLELRGSGKGYARVWVAS